MLQFYALEVSMIQALGFDATAIALAMTIHFV